MTKNCLFCSISQEPYILSMIFIYGENVYNDYISRCFFFKILIISFVRGLKGQKMAQNNKKFCLSHLIFQEAYIMWSSFMVHMMYERVISLDIASIFFSKFWFSGLLERRRGGKRAKNGPKWQKNLSITLHISGTIHHMIVILGTYV